MVLLWGNFLALVISFATGNQDRFKSRPLPTTEVNLKIRSNFDAL
jgi:hypothetical protein